MKVLVVFSNIGVREGLKDRTDFRPCDGVGVGFSIGVDSEGDTILGYIYCGTYMLPSLYFDA